jgi:hypothetical protein
LPDHLYDQPLSGGEAGPIRHQQVVADQREAEDCKDPGISLRVAFVHEHDRDIKEHSQGKKAECPHEKLKMDWSDQVNKGEGDADKTDPRHHAERGAD